MTPHQIKQVQTQKQAAEGAVTARLPETYQWLLVPEQTTPQSPVTWQATRLTGNDTLAVRVSKKLKSDERLMTSMGPTRLKMELDGVPLWRGNHVAVKQLVEDFARYLYLPRLAGPGVLTKAVSSGLELLTWQSDSFAYADGYDESRSRYRGIQGGKLVPVIADDAGLLVKPDVAQRQIEAESRPLHPAPSPGGETGTVTPPSTNGSSEDSSKGRDNGSPPFRPRRRKRADSTAQYNSILSGSDVTPDASPMR